LLAALRVRKEITIRNRLVVEFDRRQLEDLRARHRAVLIHNVRDSMVTPSDELYGADGNSWGYLWDTMFAVMAIASDDALLASYLLRNYLTSQHSNGMIPHMTMWSSGIPHGWLVTNAVWHGQRHKGRDLNGKSFRTSPITQPPLVAVAAAKVADSFAETQKRDEFIRSVLPRLVAYHRWLYRERELDDDGLVATIHPHETGRDDAPSHVELLRAIPWPPLEKLLLAPCMQRAYEHFRTDVDHGRIELEERSTTDTTLRSAYLALADLRATRRTMRRSGQARVPRAHPYLHFDPGFNAILDAANDELIRLAELAQVNLPPALLDAMTRTAAALQQFWSSSEQGFRGIDAHGRVTFRAGREIGDLLPIYSNHITPPQVRSIVDLLSDADQFGGPFLPTVNRSSPAYNADQFWRGPAWPPTTELVLGGLRRKIAHLDPADVEPEPVRTVRDTILDLGSSALHTALADRDLPEYRNSRTGEPRGARQFSWTAALTINLLDLLGFRDLQDRPSDSS
jgi:glycogen debranching enzyme